MYDGLIPCNYFTLKLSPIMLFLLYIYLKQGLLNLIHIFMNIYKCKICMFKSFEHLSLAISFKSWYSIVFCYRWLKNGIVHVDHFSFLVTALSCTIPGAPMPPLFCFWQPCVNWSVPILICSFLYCHNNPILYWKLVFSEA